MILRNFWATLKRYKAVSILNILGLTLAFTAFAVILMQVRYDLGYDKFHANADRIFRIENQDLFSEGEITFSSSISYPKILHLETFSPKINAIGGIYSNRRSVSLKTDFSSEEYPFVEQVDEITAGILDVFDFKWTQGNASGFSNPNAVVISAGQAARLFPDRPAVGQSLFTKQDSIPLEVTGVYKDFPENSTLKNIFYRVRVADTNNDQHWGAGMYMVFVLLDPTASREEMESDINGHLAAFLPDRWAKENYRLTRLHDIHFLTDIGFDGVELIDKDRTYLFLFVAILIVLIAVINFINFSNSLVPSRLKSINTQKVIGRSDRSIRVMMLVEAIGICLISALLAVWLVYFLAQTSFTDLLIAEISWQTNIPLLFGLILTAITAGVLAGIYPAFYITSFPTALVLKGSFGLSPRGKKLRTALISFQYVVSLTLIMVALFIHVQSNFMKEMPLGFDRDNILTSNISGSIASRSDAFREKLLQNPNIQNVAFANRMAVTEMTSTRATNFRGDGRIEYGLIVVSPEYPQTMGITITEGRSFEPADALKPEGNMIFNELARQHYDMELGDVVWNADVVGFASDFNFRPARLEIEPVAIQVKGSESRFSLQNAFYRLSGTDVKATIAYIETVMEEMDPNFTNRNLTFIDERIALLYEKEDKLAALVTWFGILAVCISLIGIFGLILFETQYRRKEIGIRKINGATVSEILKLLNTGFIRIVLICFVIATPIAYYTIRKWLENFAYKSIIHIWIFIAALLIVAVITLVTVTLQSYRAATENPVNAIKSE